MKDTIIREEIINHSIDKVWQAITDSEEISKWFLKAEFKAEVGSDYTFTSPGENCTKITGVIKEAAPYTLVYTWIVEDTNVETTVKWVLEDLGETTKLYLEHSGISNFLAETAVQMFESFNGGWKNCIKGLQAYLNKK